MTRPYPTTVRKLEYVTTLKYFSFTDLERSDSVILKDPGLGTKFAIGNCSPRLVRPPVQI